MASPTPANANPNLKAAPAWWFTPGVDDWKGKPWREIVLFQFMPLFFMVLLARFPAGLVIYWTWNNILSIIQQYVIMKRMGVPIGGK